MGRPGLTRHRKFSRLARLLGSDALARGHLELLWDAAYEGGDDVLGDAGDVEHVSRWQGKAGKLAAAMVTAGFLDLDEKAGTYTVHDLYDHAPEYVRKRRDRETARQAAGRTLSEVRAEAARSRWAAKQTAATGMQTGATDRPLAAVCNANGTPPSPSPSPSPSQEAFATDKPSHPPNGAEKGKPKDPALDSLKTNLEAAHREIRHAEMDWPPSAWGDLQAIRKALADDTEVLRRWRLFVADSYWPNKNVHKFRSAFTHAKYLPQKSAASPPKFGIPEFHS